ACVEDVVPRVLRLRERAVVDPGRLREIDERLDAIGNIKCKYGETAAAVATYRAEIAGALDRLERHDAIAEETEGEVAASAAAAVREAMRLSEARAEGARKLERLIQRELRTLGMDHARFRASLRRAPAGGGGAKAGAPDPTRAPSPRHGSCALSRSAAPRARGRRGFVQRIERLAHRP